MPVTLDVTEEMSKKLRPGSILALLGWLRGSLGGKRQKTPGA